MMKTNIERTKTIKYQVTVNKRLRNHLSTTLRLVSGPRNLTPQNQLIILLKNVISKNQIRK